MKPRSDERYVVLPRAIVEGYLAVVDDPEALYAYCSDPTIIAIARGATSDEHVTAGTEVRPPWSKVRNMAAQVERLVAERGPRAVHELDQLRGTMRDELDELEVSLFDEWALYHGLVWVGMVVELARNGERNGYIEHAVYSSIAEIATTIASGVLEYLPPDARP